MSNRPIDLGVLTTAALFALAAAVCAQTVAPSSSAEPGRISSGSKFRAQEPIMVVPPPCDDADSDTPLLDEHTGCGKACRWKAILGFEQANGLPLSSPAALSSRFPASGGAGRSSPGPRGTFDNTDVLHCNLDIEIFPPTQTITGSNTLTVRSLVNGLTSFAFTLRGNFAVSGAMLTDPHGTYPVTPSLPPGDNSSYLRTVTLPNTLNEGEEFTLTIPYTGVVASRGFGSIEFTTQNGVTLVSSLSEPFYAGTWWPSKDGDVNQPGDNSDKFTIELAVTAPDNLRTISNGLLQGIDVLGGARKKYRWASNYQIAPYLVCFSSTNYNTWTLNYLYPGGPPAGMPVEFNIYPSDDVQGNRDAWGQCVQMLATYRPIFGEYPFVNEKYGIYEFPFGGGMEHQTNTGQGTFVESVTAHELGHQWWGDNVTCKTWHDIWLNEGFATYTEALWEERKPGSPGLPALHAAMASRRPSSVNGTVYDFDGNNINRIFSSTFTYRKGGWVLHMLRKIVGDTTFFQILANHRAAHQGGAATSAEFAAIASSTAGRDLTFFFDPWLYQAGAPAYSYGWQTALINGQNYLRLHVRQTQVGTYTLFPMPIDIKITMGAQDQTVTIFNDAQLEHFVIPIPAAATGVLIDEFNWILNTGKPLVAYLPGPPKVVTASPVLGAAIGAGLAPSAVTIGFSANVAAAASNFTLTRSGNPVPFTFSYNAANFVATLDAGAPLAPGSYTVSVTTGVSAGGIGLDGEIADAASPASLPSGDGVTGGNAVWTFTVAACPADINSSGSVTPQDIFDFLALFFANNLGADINHDNVVSPQDIFDFLAAFFTPCP